MVAVQTDLIDRAAAEAFIQLARTTDKFERYENPHAQRIAAVADEIATSFHLARHDRGSLRLHHPLSLLRTGRPLEAAAD